MASPFASRVHDTIPIPFDPPNTVTVRKLTGREYEAAQEAHARSVLSGRSRGWNQLFRKSLEVGVKDAQVLEGLRDPLTGFDRLAIVRAGVVAWSYDLPLKPVAATETTPAVDAIDDLDDEALEFFALEVMKRTKPALFAEAGEAQKND